MNGAGSAHLAFPIVTRPLIFCIHCHFVYLSNAKTRTRRVRIIFGDTSPFMGNFDFIFLIIVAVLTTHAHRKRLFFKCQLFYLFNMSCRCFFCFNDISAIHVCAIDITIFGFLDINHLFIIRNAYNSIVSTTQTPRLGNRGRGNKMTITIREKLAVSSEYSFPKTRCEYELTPKNLMAAMHECIRIYKSNNRSYGSLGSGTTWVQINDTRVIARKLTISEAQDIIDQVLAGVWNPRTVAEKHADEIYLRHD